MFGLEFFIAVVLAFVAGYVTRKFVEKKWPAEAAKLDAKAKFYGEQAKDKFDDLSKK